MVVSSLLNYRVPHLFFLVAASSLLLPATSWNLLSQPNFQVSGPASLLAARSLFFQSQTGLQILCLHLILEWTFVCQIDLHLLEFTYKVDKKKCHHLRCLPTNYKGTRRQWEEEHPFCNLPQNVSLLPAAACLLICEHQEQMFLCIVIIVQIYVCNMMQSVKHRLLLGAACLLISEYHDQMFLCTVIIAWIF